MKLYLRERSLYGKEYDIYNDLTTAINEKGIAKLYEIDLKDYENICSKSLYEKVYYINKDGKTDWESITGDNHYTFIIKSGEDVHNMTIEEMVKRVKKFQKRLKKFDEIEFAKYKIGIQIRDLQSKLDELNGK